MDFVRRPGDRYPQHRGARAGALGGDPEWLAPAQVDGLARSERNLQAEHFQVAAGRNVLGNREARRVGFRVAAQEVEDAVVAGMFTGGEIRPGHRRLRRIAGAEPLVMAVGGQAAEVRQFALGHPALGKPRVHAVEAEHHQPALGGGLRRIGRAEHGKQSQSGQQDQWGFPAAASRHRGFACLVRGDGGGRGRACVAGLTRSAFRFQHTKPAQQ